MTTLLVVLACPVSMGVIMWLMMRGGRQTSSATPEHLEQRRRIAALERELADLREAREDNGDTDVVVAQKNASPTLVDV